MSPFPLPPLLHRWGADDLTTLMRRRCAAGEDGARIGFWDRGAQAYREEAQSSFFARATALAEQQAESGTSPGSHVLVACDDPEATLLGFVSSVLLGSVPAVVAVRSGFDPPAVVAERLRRTRSLLGPGATAVVEPATAAAVQATGGAAPSVMVDPRALPSHVTGTLEGLRSAPGSVSHLQLTSGSTGVGSDGGGKAVIVTHRSLFANLAAMSRRLELDEDSVIVTWLPLYHDMGLVGQAILALVHEIDLFLMTPFDFVLEPARWLRTISERRGTMSASPTFGYELVRRRISDDDLPSLDLSSWKTACCGAEPVSAAVLGRFIKRFSPYGLRAATMKPCYGLAEATLAVTLAPVEARWRAVRVERSSLSKLGRLTATPDPEATSPSPDELDVVALGPPLDGFALRLVDDEGRSVTDPLVCGEVVVEGDSVAGGYLAEGGVVVPFDEGGLRTGDIGFLEGGELFIVERIKNIVIRNGQNHSVLVLEETLAALAGVAVHNVMVLDADVQRGAQLTGIIEIDPTADPDRPAAAVMAGLDQFELALDALVFVRAGSLPRTTSGKRQHAEVRRRLLAGELETIAHRQLLPAAGVPSPPSGSGTEVTTDELNRLVLALVARQVRDRGLEIPVVDGSRFVHDLDFDSLAMLELAIACEERFAVQIPEHALPSVRTVADLVGVVAHAPVGQETLGITHSLSILERSIPQTYRTVQEQRGREVRIDGRWVTDFASCNYLGLDLHPDVIAAVGPALAAWGVHPSWTRAVASPAPYGQLERALARLLGATDTVVFPTVTLLHFGVLPKLAGSGGGIILDSAAHHSLQEAAALARARGTAVTTFRHGDAEDLGRQLTRMADRSARIVAVDGIYSMSGNEADLAPLLDLARLHDATVYVDDAHGIGVMGERPGPAAPYGLGGSGVVRHQGLGYERLVYVAGLSKAFSSLAAFVTCADDQQRAQIEAASTMVFSGPVPVASLATALAGLEVNDREGDALRARLWRLTDRLLRGVADLGLEVDNRSGFPIVNVVLGPTAAVLAACETLWEHGFLLTPALFPAAPLDRGGVRFTLTAANTEAQVDRLLDALDRVRGASGVRRPVSVGSN